MNTKKSSSKNRILSFFGKKPNVVNVSDSEKVKIKNSTKSSAELRIGIIGAGRMGITHYSIINGLDDVRVVAIADTSQQLLSMFEKYMDISCFTNWEDMLTDVKLDAVLICTPPTYNNEILDFCSAKNIHVFIEKPFLIESQDAFKHAEIYAKKQLINQVGYVNRYNAIFMRVKELVVKGAIGKTVRFKSEMFSSTVSEPQTTGGWRANQKSGGGVTFEMATHALDLVIYLFGNPKNVCGTGFSKVFSQNVDDIASTNFMYESGLMGSLFVNWSDCTRRKPVNSIEIIGTKGSIIADQYELKVFMNEPNLDEKLKDGWNVFSITDLFYSVPFYVRGNEFTLQLLKFVEDVKSKTYHSNACTFTEAATTLKLIENMTADFIKSKEGEIE